MFAFCQVVAPKKARLGEAQESLAETMALLNSKREELAEVEAKLANLKRQFKETTEKKEHLEFQVSTTHLPTCLFLVLPVYLLAGLPAFGTSMSVPLPVDLETHLWLKTKAA